MGGSVAVTRCPQLEVTSDVWDAIEAAGFARRGAWPRDGGTLNQTVSFLTACRIALSEEDAVRAEMKLEAME